MTLYLDLTFLLNFLLDFLLFLAVNRLMGFPSPLKRLLPAALLGGLYGALTMVSSLSYLRTPLAGLLALIFMTLIAFGFSVSALRRGALFLLLSMALGGIALSIHRANFPILLLEALGLWLLTCLCFGDSKIGTEYVPITVSQGNRSLRFTALKDTGNQLRDPVTGEPVIVVAPEEARRLTGLTESQLSAPLETMLNPPVQGLRLIPYKSVGNPGGMLLGLRFHSVKIGNQEGEALLAFAPQGLGGGLYQALA